MLVSKKKIQKEIEKLFKQHPQLKSVEVADDDYCCTGCVKTSIGYALGWVVADAWEDLQDYYYLLDKDINGKNKK